MLGVASVSTSRSRETIVQSVGRHVTLYSINTHTHTPYTPRGSVYEYVSILRVHVQKSFEAATDRDSDNALGRNRPWIRQ